jgi:ribosomal protein S18 acetylase RimI-like enzyme
MSLLGQNLVINLRSAEHYDLQKIVDLDAAVSGIEKKDYWQDRFSRLTNMDGRHLIVAEPADVKKSEEILGFIVGEVRAWEFGSYPCGWIFAIGVRPEYRIQGIGGQLFNAMCDAFKDDGAGFIRTMIARKDQLNMSFFRAQGMMGGPFIELEKPLD